MEELHVAKGKNFQTLRKLPVGCARLWWSNIISPQGTIILSCTIVDKYLFGESLEEKAVVAVPPTGLAFDWVMVVWVAANLFEIVGEWCWNRCAGAHIEDARLIISVSLCEQRIPSIRAEQGPSCYGFDISTFLHQRVAGLADLGKPPDLIITVTIYMRLGHGDGNMVAIPALFQKQSYP